MPSLSPTRRLRRRANRRFYRVLFRFYRAVFPGPRWPGRLPATSVRRVLLVRHDHIGDMVATTPLIAFLREHLPSAEIDVLASSISAPLVAADERVTRLLVNDHTWLSWLRVLPDLRARRYDAVFSLVYGRGLREGLTASLVAHRGTHKVSVWRPARYAGFFTTIARPPRSALHMADQLLFVGYHALGLRWPGADDAAARYPMRLATPDDAEERAAAFLAERQVGRFVVLNLAATDAFREWRPDAGARFASAVLSKYPDLAVVVPPPPGKETPARELARLCDSPRLVVSTPFPLLDLVALLRRASAVVTPDTGMLHLGSACGRPILALFTPTSVHLERWLPWRVPYRVVMATPGRTISDIDPGRIVAAFDELYAAVRGPAPASRVAP